MKHLNTMLYTTEATKELAGMEKKIEAAESYDQAKAEANRALGFIDALILFNNCMVARENNDFTEQFSDVLEAWTADVYQAMIDVAVRTEQPDDVVAELCNRRDSHRDE